MNERADQLYEFVGESNRIEGILREPTTQEFNAHAGLLSLKRVLLGDVQSFVAEVAGAQLRCHAGMDVRVGAHVPPPGGPEITDQLAGLLLDLNGGSATPYAVHLAYEHLHPFMDGNGRSGRALWAWQMLRDGRDPFALPFLHSWYYDSLDWDRGTPS